MYLESEIDRIPKYKLSENKIGLKIEKLEHLNDYDFTTVHKHLYYEIIFFTKGGGDQMIDFEKKNIEDNSCCLIFPNQVHLLKRDNNSQGVLIQFTEEFVGKDPKLLFFLKKASIQRNYFEIFKNDDKIIFETNLYLEIIEHELIKGEVYSKDIILNILYGLLYKLMHISGVNFSRNSFDSLPYKFIEMIEEEYFINHQVKHYSKKMGITEKRLVLECTKQFNLTPLKLIHNRILLEAKRLLSLKCSSKKEIAYSLGFNSASSFSSFIKEKTGHTPSQLFLDIDEIHK